MFLVFRLHHIFVVLLIIKKEKKMKTIKSILLVAIMLGTFINYAAMITKPTDTVDGKNVRVEFKSVKMGQALTIKDDNGKIHYNRLVENDGDFSMVFDLSSLPNGNYKAELDKNFEIIIKSFKITDGIVTFFTQEDVKVFKPIIRKKGGLLYVSKKSFNKKPLNIIIYYNNKIIVKDKVKEDLNKVYRLPEDKKGNYKIVIKSNEREYLEIV